MSRQLPLIAWCCAAATAASLMAFAPDEPIQPAELGPLPRAAIAMPAPEPAIPRLPARVRWGHSRSTFRTLLDSLNGPHVCRLRVRRSAP